MPRHDFTRIDMEIMMCVYSVPFHITKGPPLFESVEIPFSSCGSACRLAARSQNRRSDRGLFFLHPRIDERASGRVEAQGCVGGHVALIRHASRERKAAPSHALTNKSAIPVVSVVAEMSPFVRASSKEERMLPELCARQPSIFRRTTSHASGWSAFDQKW